MMVNLHELAGKGDLEAVRNFLKRSSSNVDRTNREGQTTLHCAAKGGHLDVCRDLIEAGANPNTEDGQNRTPMWIAVDSNRAGVVRLLCETGAHTSQAGPEGRTPLHMAARKGFIECAELLLKHGAVVEGNPDKWGKTPGDECVTSDIRLLIDAARRERAAAFPEYTPQVPTAPPLTEGNYAPDAVGPYPYPQDEEVATSTAVSTPCGGGASGSSVESSRISAASKAREAAKVGGSQCSACFGPERSRQLTPCNHVVCEACTRTARNEGDNVCPVCRERIFDDVPLMASS